MLAYAEYKIAKNTFCRRYFEKHNRKPTESDIENFLLQFDERRMAELKKNAIDVLISFSSDYAEDEIKKAREEGADAAIVSEVKKQGGVIRGLAINLGASALFSAIIFFLVAAATIANPDSKVAKIFQALTDDNAQLTIQRPLAVPNQ